MIKKIIFSLILFTLLIGCKEENIVPSIWNGETDTKWYKESKNEFTITTAEQLAGFAELVNGGNDFEGKVIKLGRNIMLNDTANWQDWVSSVPANEWTSIEKFNGIFDGNGYVINGIYTSNSDYNQGLFKYINFGIKNFKFYASYIKDKELIAERVFTIITPQQLENWNDENNLNLAVIVSNNYLEIRVRGRSLPELFFKDMNVYEELANSLTMIHNRFIDSPDFDKIIIVFTNNMVSDEIFTNVVDKVKEAGFFKANLAKIDEEELRKYKEEEIKKQEKALKKSKKTPRINTQGGLKIYGISNMEIRSINNSGETEAKVKVSGGTPGEIGNALGNLMSEQMKKERRR